LLSVITSLIGVIVFMILKGSDKIANMILPFIVNKTIETVPTADNTVGMPRQMFDDLSRLLIQSIIDCDKEMTVMIAEKMAGSPFITKPRVKWDNGFPAVETTDGED
jgi:hypothetical protein